MLRYRVLGVPTLWMNGVERPVAAARDRMLLCLLLLRANRVVTLDEVIVASDGTEVARHPRCLAKHQSLLAADHARILRAMRAEAALAAGLDAEVEERDLTVYDQITGAA